jgi:hypothetical protein
MSHTQRLLYAGAFTGVATAISLFVWVFVSPETVTTFFREPYWVALFVVAYLLAPVVSRYLPHK